MTDAEDALRHARSHLDDAEALRPEVDRAVEGLRRMREDGDPYTTSIEQLFRGQTS